MNRRDSIKSILLGSLAGGVALQGCSTEGASEVAPKEITFPDYGRTSKEQLRDKELLNEVFFNEHEIATIAVLCDIILPSNENFGSATDAEVPAFVEFIVKDIEEYQLSLRGGIMWLDNFSNKLYNKEFISCAELEQKNICDQIAYPEETEPELLPGEKFFTNMRNLTLTGYYTSKMGIEDLGYKGNGANIWDGVPAEVLEKHGLKYDEEWLAKCVNQENRSNIAVWDDEGNLTT
ncbi:gluconate 2-dehydrogenase subunit 3 family protein [Seonamhaeicola maritimus]|uniref:gluconate 2-dehydrogenase subunit 3 family protein n=1 Tax=Seonamhaeicola maritimus TaxID=2591822 RepID=UPI00249513D5|nr:gluconate 2-dehydrogenase subunit 3 family protein [Seonamhaeicola maritimus]